MSIVLPKDQRLSGTDQYSLIANFTDSKSIGSAHLGLRPNHNHEFCASSPFAVWPEWVPVHEFFASLQQAIRVQLRPLVLLRVVFKSRM